MDRHTHELFKRLLEIAGLTVDLTTMSFIDARKWRNAFLLSVLLNVLLAVLCIACVIF